MRPNGGNRKLVGVEHVDPFRKIIGMMNAETKSPHAFATIWLLVLCFAAGDSDALATAPMTLSENATVTSIRELDGAARRIGSDWEVEFHLRGRSLTDKAIGHLVGLTHLKQLSVWQTGVTDFGRTPKINKNGGRDHYPNVYSQILAGGGIRGGQVYGSSDVNAAKPKSNPCPPADFHATMYQAMGIDAQADLHDRENRPFQICNGQPLPLF